MLERNEKVKKFIGKGSVQHKSGWTFTSHVSTHETLFDPFVCLFVWPSWARSGRRRRRLKKPCGSTRWPKSPKQHRDRCPNPNSTHLFKESSRSNIWTRCLSAMPLVARAAGRSQSRSRSPALAAREKATALRWKTGPCPAPKRPINRPWRARVPIIHVAGTWSGIRW